MDSQGNILPPEEVEQVRRSDPRRAKTLVEVPPGELDGLLAATRQERIAWHKAQTKAQRKRRNREARERNGELVTATMVRPRTAARAAAKRSAKAERQRLREAAKS